MQSVVTRESYPRTRAFALARAATHMQSKKKLDGRQKLPTWSDFAQTSQTVPALKASEEKKTPNGFVLR